MPVFTLAEYDTMLLKQLLLLSTGQAGGGVWYGLKKLLPFHCKLILDWGFILPGGFETPCNMAYF